MARLGNSDFDESRSVSRRKFFGQTVPACGGFAAFSHVLSSANASERWTQFLGNDGTGVSTSSVQPPTRWTQDEGIRWRTAIRGDGWSSPVVADGVVYLTAAMEKAGGKRRELVIHKIDFEDGRLLDTYSVFDQAADREYRIHPKNSNASPTLILDGDQLFVHFGYQGTARMTTSGERVWENRELTFAPVHGNGGSPILLDDQLIFTCDGAEDPYIAALDRETGGLRWRTDRPVDAERKFSFATPSAVQIDGQTQVIAPGSDCILALDPISGRILWKFESPGFSVVPKPMFVGGRIIYCTGFMRPSLIALKPGTAKTQWEPEEIWRVDRNVPKTPTPVVDGDAIVMVSDEGIITRVQYDNGDVGYRKRLGGNYSASPILINDRIYLTNEDGETTVIKTGADFEELAVNSIGERTLATPAFADGSLLLRTEDAIYRIGS